MAQLSCYPTEYIEYYKNKIADANIGLMFGHLLVEMGEYNKAETYFNNILNSSNPNDEEIACIYFNFGRTYRFKGDFNRAMDYYTRAYDLHIKAKPKRLYSAAKASNGLGLVFREQNNLEKALEYFQKTLKLYDQSIPRQHIDVANTLINLSSIQCDEEKVRKSIKITTFIYI
jgi:tetratricopeptide (TPR) repeat protein